jgi:hypothetical protein
LIGIAAREEGVMKRWMQAERKNRGQALIMAMIFLLALTFLGFGLVTIATLDSASAKSLRLSTQVLEAAEEGVIAGMAFSADPITGFKAQSTGYSHTFKAGDFYAGDKKSPLQYEVTVIMRGNAPSPAGWVNTSTKTSGQPWGTYTFMLVEVRSTGYIYERPYHFKGNPFDWAKTPTIRRTITVMARVMVANN